MAQHPAVRNSFFIRVLVATALIGNLYLFLQSLAHTFGLHQLDLFLRWYPFKANQFMNILLSIGTLITLLGLRKIFIKGLEGIRLYGIGKLITTAAYAILIFFEYKISNLPFPLILIPVLIGIESIYPVLLYISLRKSKARGTH